MAPRPAWMDSFLFHPPYLPAKPLAHCQKPLPCCFEADVCVCDCDGCDCRYADTPDE